MQPKICFFTLETTWGTILALDQVQKRGLALVCRCYLCQECEKSMDHLFLCCIKMRTLWELLFFLFEVSWMFLNLRYSLGMEWIFYCQEV